MQICSFGFVFVFCVFCWLGFQRFLIISEGRFWADFLLTSAKNLVRDISTADRPIGLKFLHKLNFNET